MAEMFQNYPNAERSTVGPIQKESMYRSVMYDPVGASGLLLTNLDATICTRRPNMLFQTVKFTQLQKHLLVTRTAHSAFPKANYLIPPPILLQYNPRVSSR